MNKYESIMMRVASKEMVTPYVEMFDDEVKHVVDCAGCGDRFVSDVPVDYCTRCLNGFRYHNWYLKGK